MDFKNKALSADKRARLLLDLMTDEEKIWQLRPQLLFAEEYPQKRDFRAGHCRNIGHFIHVDEAKSPAVSAELINSDTKKSIEASRFGIPVLQHGESLHGADWCTATVFPQSIAMAAAFDTELMYEVADAIGKECRAGGVRQVLSPVVNIARDSRWGRTEETFGEDVYLSSQMGLSYVKAIESNGVIATPKHFVDNYGDGGRDSNYAHNEERELREVYLKPFEVCVKEGGCRSIMPSYNALDGVPAVANKWLLQKVLRGEWGFGGFAVSDYYGVSGLSEQYNVFGATGAPEQFNITEDYASAQAMAFNAGLDVDLPNGYTDLKRLLDDGRIDRKVLDKYVFNILKIKFESGLFDEPFADVKNAEKTVRCAAHRKLALKAARRSIVLLKNDGVLPLKKTYKKIAVLGENANSPSLGGYTGPYGGYKGELPAPTDELRKAAGKGCDVRYYGGADKIEADTDCAVFFTSMFEGEGVDRCDIRLPSKSVFKEGADTGQIVDKTARAAITFNQEEEIVALRKKGIPVIVVLVGGSSIDMSAWIDGTNAVLETWYLGEAGAQAIAETVFGVNNPCGKLPITFPKHVGQMPLYYSHKPTGRANHYAEGDSEPQFEFGFGLSYTTFKTGGFKTETDGSGLAVCGRLENTGGTDGAEVVQLYIRGYNSGVARPVKELRAFARAEVKAGQSRGFTLKLSEKDFYFYDAEMKYGMWDSDYDVMAGTSCKNILYTQKVKVRNGKVFQASKDGK